MRRKYHTFPWILGSEGTLYEIVLADMPLAVKIHLGMGLSLASSGGFETLAFG